MLVVGGAFAAVVGLIAAVPSALAALVAGVALAARDVRDAAADEVGETEAIDDDSDVDAGAAMDADVEATLDVSDLAQAAAAPPTLAAPATLEGIQSLLGEGMAALDQAATSLGEQLAERVRTFLVNADDSLYAVGTWGGWAVATATVGLLSAAATGCASLVAKFVTKLGPILRWSAAGARTLGALAGRLGDAYSATSAHFDELLSGLNRLSKLLPITWFLDLITALRARLLGYLARVTAQVAKLRAQHAKSRRRSKRKQGEPSGKGQEDGTARPADVTSAANQAAKAVYRGAATTLLTPARAATLARASLAEPGLKAEVVIDQRTWRVRVARPKRGTVAAAAATSTTSGWVATAGTNGAGASYIGATDPTTQHKDALEKLHTAYEAEWQALCQTVDHNEHEVLAGRKNELAKLIQADIAYENAALSVSLTKHTYGDTPTVMWTATIAPNATEMKRPLTAVGTGSRWDEEIGRFVPDTERAAVRRALEAQAALNAPDATWAAHAVPYLLGQPPFVSPLSGGLSVAGLNKVVSECQVVREGSARDYDSAIHFGKRELAAMQDEGARTGAPLQRAVGGALLGVGADVDSAVKAWLKVLPSGQISDEESGRVDPTSGRWDTSGERHRPQGLFFCWPKHLQWKGEAPKNGYEPHNHHVWPQWIGGKQSETLPMSAHFHNRLFHSGAFEAKLAKRIVARDKKYQDLERSAKSAQGLYGQLEEQGTAREFVDVTCDELRLLYQEFADAHVAIGRSEFLIEVEQILAQVQLNGPSW